MKTQITAFFMAWGMFLSIPCPAKIWDEKARPWQLVYLPLVGLLVGGSLGLGRVSYGAFRKDSRPSAPQSWLRFRFCSQALFTWTASWTAATRSCPGGI